VAAANAVITCQAFVYLLSFQFLIVKHYELSEAMLLPQSWRTARFASISESAHLGSALFQAERLNLIG
jgi:hypothetical protein